MNRLLVYGLLSMLGTFMMSAHSQEENVWNTSSFVANPKNAEKEVFVAVEKPAEFHGGLAALMQFLANEIHYPEEAVKKGIEGRVIVRFIVEPDGTVGNAEIVNPGSPILEEEALRVVKQTSGKWSPGMNNGKIVRSYFNLPIMFKLPDNPDTEE